LRTGPGYCVRRLAGALLLSTSTVAWGQERAVPPDDERIVVTGYREILGVPAERSLTEDDISTYGLGNVGELLDEIAAETGESRDEPVFLVNGDRVTDLAAVEDFPTEAVERVDVLPVGSASKVGASSTRRVYNIVLKRQVDTIAARAAWRVATEGGWSAERGDVSYTRIRADQRLNASARLRHEDRLHESERDIIQPAGSPSSLGRARSLRPELTGFDLKLSAADRLAPWLQGSASARLNGSDQSSLIGLVPVSLLTRHQERDATGAGFNLSLNADVGEWLVSLLGTYDYDRTKTRTQRIDPGDPLAIAVSRTAASSRAANADLTATGPLVDLPAGPLRATLGASLGRDSIRTDRNFLGVETDDRYVQWSRSATGGIEIPIASRKNGFLPALGELSANAEFTRTRVSHFGAFSNQTWSLQWQPDEWLRLFGSVTTGKTPPSVASVADPIIETPGVRYYDPVNSETVDVTEISGGNPALGAQRAANRRVSISIKPAPKLALNLFADYFGTRNRDIISALPPASDLIIAAFPDRFIRDLGGTLVAVDVRPVSFARQSEDRLRYGFNLNLPLGTNASGKAGGPRLQVNAAHSWVLDSELRISSGFEPIDLLSPDAIGLGSAGRPRHQFDFTLGYADRGLGLRLNAQHRGKSYLSLVSEGTTDRLKFSPLTTLNLRAFATGARVSDAPWLKGTRLSLSVLNALNDKQRIRDSAGVTPLSYQQDYRDPLGRTIEVELRKVF
jgi:hypothetical protein